MKGTNSFFFDWLFILIDMMAFEFPSNFVNVNFISIYTYIF